MNGMKYNWATLEETQVTSDLTHKSFTPFQFKDPFDSSELYQSIKIFWSFGSIPF